MHFFPAFSMYACDCGCESVSSSSKESSGCELVKQQREATTPAYSNDACLTESFQTRLKVVLSAALHACTHQKTQRDKSREYMCACVCVCVFLHLWTGL